ncbi:class V lanthionine synthetase subunit LxmK [Streptomyces sp. NPDC003710]
MSADDRYRTLPVKLESAPAVTRLLQSLGIGTLDDAGVVSHIGRNDNWAGTTTSGTPVFIKRLGGQRRDIRRRLAAIRAFEELRAAAAERAPSSPRCLGWSEEDAIVVFELLPDSRSGAELADADAFDDKHAYRVGEMLGGLHSLDGPSLVALEEAPPPLPPLPYFDALPLEGYQAASFAEVELWRLLQQDERLAEAVRRLRADENRAPICPIHGDFRLDQVLLAHGTLHLLDWEEMRRGDPARDIGAYTGEWLHRAIRTLSGTDDADVVTRGVRELTRLRPMVEHFREGYQAIGHDLDRSLVLRSVGFAGWHVIDRVMAAAAQRPTLSPLERAALGIARTVLITPAAVIAPLGLED